MKRKEFIRLTVPAVLLLANGKIVKATNYILSEEHQKNVQLRFAVASDGHYGQPGTEYEKFFSTIVSRINEEHATHSFSFCMINGDIIHDDKTHFPAAKKALDALQMKYYVSQGNHDKVTKEEWETIWNIPVNVDFAIKNNSFLVGTTSDEKGTYLCPDVKWFAEKLEIHKRQKNIFIFIHINPGKQTKNAVDCPEFFELLAKHKNVRAIFNGHDHDEEGIKRKMTYRLYLMRILVVIGAHRTGAFGLLN